MNFKKMMSLFLTSLMTISLFPPNVVSAENKDIATLSNTAIGTSSGNYEYISTLQTPFISVDYGSGSKTVYCMNELKDFPMGVTYTRGADYTKNVDKAVLYYGYSGNMSKLREKYPAISDDEARYYTQVVMWSIAGEGDLYGDKDRGVGYHDDLRAVAKNTTVPTPTFSINNKSITLSDKGSYQESGVIQTTKGTDTTGTFTFPSTSEVWSVDTNGAKKNTFNVGESFKIRAATSKTGTENLNVNVTLNDFEFRRWVPSDPKYQELSELAKTTRSSQITLNLSYAGVGVSQSTLTINKKNEIGQNLQGVVFGLFSDSAANTKLEEKATDSNGNITFAGLTNGQTYYVKELSGLEGYIVDNTIHSVVMDSANKTLNAVNTRKAGNLRVTKVDSKDNSPLSGVEFKVKGLSGFATGSEWTITTGNDGVASLNNLLYGTYEVTEIKAKEGYVLDSTPKQVSIQNNGELKELAFSNDKIVGEVHFSKTDLTTGNIVEGATIKIEGLSDHNKGFSTEFISSKNGNKIKLEYGKYRITETIAPEGYVKTDEVSEFEIRTNGEVVQAMLKNQRIGGVLFLSKIDMNSKDIIDGATITVRGLSDHNKDFEHTFVSTKDTLSLDLDYGKYQVTEINAPEGYVKTDEVFEFEIDTHGKVVTLDLENKRIEGELHFTKTDLSTGEIVEGAKIKIEGLSDHNKDFVYEFVSSKDGDKIKLEYGKYKITETIAPEGYVKTDEVGEFEIKEDGEVVMAELKNKRIEGELHFTKTDLTSGEVIEGAKIKIEGLDEHNKDFVHEFVSSKDGNKIKLEYGKYQITETIAPEGYVKTDEVGEFEIKEDGEVVMAELKNKRIAGSLKIIKIDSKDSSVLEGATFEVYTKDNKLVEKVTTNKKGEANIETLYYGDYYLKEVKAPNDYKLSNEIVNFSVKNDGELITVKFKNDKVEIKSEIPFAGGIPSYVYIVIGASIIGVSSLLLLNKKRR